MGLNDDKSELLPCVICGRVNPTRWRIKTHAGPTISIATCSDCGHVYQCPQQNKSYAKHLYENAYSEADADGHPYFNPDLKLAHSRELLKVVQAHCPDVRRLLEVGSGQGAFVRAARDSGIDATGTEMAEMAVRKAKNTFDVDLHFGEVDDLPRDTEFDAAVMWDVIEHCPHPDRVLHAVSDRLRDGGVILLTTGNYQSADRLGSGWNWWCWEPDHYHYFSPTGLSQLANNLGLEGSRAYPVVRLRAPSQGNQPAPSPVRFLNPFHVARGLKSRTLRGWARLRWPEHWNIGVMLIRMTKE